MISLVCWLQSSKIPRNNPSFVYHAQIGCRNQPRHLGADLAGGEMRLGLCFSWQRKRPWTEFWATQHSSESSFSFTQLLRACRTCSTSLPTQLTSFTPSSSNAWNIFLNTRGLLGEARSGYLCLFIHSANMYGALPICQASSCWIRGSTKEAPSLPLENFPSSKGKQTWWK